MQCRQWASKLEEEQKTAQRIQNSIKDESEVRLESLRHQLTTKLSQQTDQMDEKFRTIRLESTNKTEELEILSRTLRKTLEEERETAESQRRRLQTELNEHKQELEKNAQALQKADSIVKHMDQSWIKVKIILS